MSLALSHSSSTAETYYQSPSLSDIFSTFGVISQMIRGTRASSPTPTPTPREVERCVEKNQGVDECVGKGRGMGKGKSSGKASRKMKGRAIPSLNREGKGKDRAILSPSPSPSLDNQQEMARTPNSSPEPEEQAKAQKQILSAKPELSNKEQATLLKPIRRFSKDETSLPV